MKKDTMNKMLIKLSEKKLVNTKSAFLFGEVKVEEEAKQAEVKDNKPAEQQYSADQVFNFMAGTAVVAKAKVNDSQAQEARIGGFMADFEKAFDFAKELGLSDEAALAILDRI